MCFRTQPVIKSEAKVCRDQGAREATWDTELMWSLRGAINLYTVKTGSSLSCPVAALWWPGPWGQQRPQRETNTQHLSLLLPPSPSIPLLHPAHTLSVALRPTVCLPSPPSISITPLCSDLSQTQRGSLVYSRTERRGGGSSSLVLSSCLFVRPFRIVRRSERKSKESWL